MSPQFSHNFDILTLDLEGLEPLNLALLMRLLLVCLAAYCYFIHIQTDFAKRKPLNTLTTNNFQLVLG